MNRNYPLLVAGLLSWLFAGGHMYWGQHNIMVQLQSMGIDPALTSLIWMGWNLQTSTTLLSGVALIAAALGLVRRGVLPLAWFIFAINVGRYILLMVMAVPGIVAGTYEMSELAAQSVGLFVYLAVIYLGIRQAASTGT